MEPIIVAGLAGLPVVDGDGMGRAFPEVQMTTFFIYGAQPSPAAIADEKGNVVVFRHVIDMFWLEKFAREKYLMKKESEDIFIVAEKD